MHQGMTIFVLNFGYDNPFSCELFGKPKYLSTPKKLITHRIFKGEVELASAKGIIN